MKNLLIVSGHTYESMSVTNREILRRLQLAYPNAQVDNLHELYPTFAPDVVAEKNKLLWADTILIQSPVFWYGPSSAVARWMEEVWQEGWAYGSQQALAGKRVALGLTAGELTEAYTTGEAGITTADLFRPLKVGFEYCKMDYLGGVLTGGAMNSGTPTPEERAHMEQLALRHTTELIALLGA